MKETQNEIQNEAQQQRRTPRWVTIKLAGVFFAIYAVYNVFILFRDRKELPLEGTIITAVVAVLFGLLTVFAWTAEAKNVLFVVIRRTVFILVLIALLALKLNLVVRVISFLDISSPYTVLYAGSYFLTQAAFLILLVYYVFVLKNLPLYPKLSVLLPVVAILFFLSSFVMEMVLFFTYNIGLEGNGLRTIVIRPVFYLGFILLCVFFLFPLTEEAIVPESPL